jgi:hypothetical protein
VTEFLQLSIFFCQHRKSEKQSSFSLSHHQTEFRNDPRKATLIIPLCLTVYHRKTENEVQFWFPSLVIRLVALRDKKITQFELVSILYWQHSG